MPRIPADISAKATLHARLVGIGNQFALEKGYRVTGMEQFDTIQPWKGIALLHLSYGYLVVWCNREHSDYRHFLPGAHVDSLNMFGRTRQDMRRDEPPAGGLPA